MSNWFSVDPKEHLKGKTAIVLGGNSGIGEASARALAAAGAQVVISGIPADQCASVANDINREGGEAIAVSCDATKQQEITSLIAATVEAYGGIDIAVSTCGIAVPRQDILTFSPEQWRHIMSVNVDANFFFGQAVAKVMKTNKDGGRMVFVSSARGSFPMINAGPYSISKAAVMGIVRAFCIDLAQYNITVNGIAPGIVETQMTKKVFEELPHQRDFVMERTPLKNTGTVDDMAAAILLFCLPESRYTSGQTLILDGGWSVNS